ncbi:MAG: transglutaminase-like domain-containing protein, partial [Candidatus Nanoarchaeia archaeon]
MNSNLITDEKAEKITALAHAILVILSAVLYSVTSDKFCAAVTCSLIIALQFFTKQRIEYTDRSIIYTSIFAFIYSYGADLFSPFDKNFYIIIGDIFSTSVSAPFLLYLAAATALFKYNEYAFGVSAAFCMMSILLTSDINPNASGLKLNTYYSMYFTIIALITSAMILGIQTLKNVFLKRPKNAKGIIKKTLLFLAIFSSLAFSGISIFAIRKFENSIRLLDIFITKYALLHLQKGRHIAFGKDVNLNKTIDPYVRRNSAKIVIRAVASSPPEYLRGRAYDKYMNGRWTDSNSLATIKMRLARQENILAFNRFLDDDCPENVSSMSETRIFPEKILLSEVLVAPPNCAALDIFANAIARSPNGNIYPEEWDRGTAFTAYGIQDSEQNAFRAPSPPLDKRLLEIHPSLENEIDLLLAEAINKEKGGIPKTDREIIRILEKHFLENFKYEIVEDTSNCPIKDPISSFFNRKTGHCELFATAMTLALRRYGIPSRYVTGFVCNEYNPQGKYYVSRLGDAHAWCEAYLRDEGKWILAEPTPPSAIPLFKHEWGTFERLFDAFKTLA